MSIGRDIIKQVITSGDIQPYLDTGLTATWIKLDPASQSVFDGIDRTAWLEIVSLYDAHGTVMPEEMFRLQFPEESYPFPVCDYPVPELLRQVTSATGMVHIQALAGIRTEMGILLGIDLIDDAFWGFQPGQLVSLLGPRETTKTTLMVNSALASWDRGYDVLFFSTEQGTSSLRQIMNALGARVSLNRFQRGMLTDFEKDQVRQFHDQMHYLGASLRFAHHQPPLTVAKIRAEVEEHRPHAVYVDGFHLMRDTDTGKFTGTDWHANGNVAIALKHLAMEKEMVVVASSPVQKSKRLAARFRAGDTTGAHGLLNASDIVFGADRDDDGRTIVSEVFSRFSHIPDAMVTWDWDTMDMSVVEWVDEEISRSSWADAIGTQIISGQS